VDNDSGARLADRLLQYTDVGEITLDILDNLLSQVLVFPGGKLEIRWQFQDEWERTYQLIMRE